MNGEHKLLKPYISLHIHRWIDQSNY